MVIFHLVSLQAKRVHKNEQINRNKTKATLPSHSDLSEHQKLWIGQCWFFYGSQTNVTSDIHIKITKILACLKQLQKHAINIWMHNTKVVYLTLRRKFSRRRINPNQLLHSRNRNTLGWVRKKSCLGQHLRLEIIRR